MLSVKTARWIWKETWRIPSAELSVNCIWALRDFVCSAEVRGSSCSWSLELGICLFSYSIKWFKGAFVNLGWLSSVLRWGNRLLMVVETYNLFMGLGGLRLVFLCANLKIFLEVVNCIFFLIDVWVGIKHPVSVHCRYLEMVHTPTELVTDKFYVGY